MNEHKNQEIRQPVKADFASPGIYTSESGKIWACVTARSTYALGITSEGYVVNLYWGGRLASFADLPVPRFVPGALSHDTTLSDALEEFPAFGGTRYGELAAQVAFADGVRDLDLRYERSSQVTQAEGLYSLEVVLRDQVYPLLVTLRYQVDVVNDVLIRSAIFANQGSETLRLERAFSAVWHLPLAYTPRVLTTLAGQWAGETQIQRQSVVPGTTLLESRRGITSLHALPWFALEGIDPAGSSPPEVYFGTLAWSGNWMLRVTTDVNGRTALSGGLSDHDFAWLLRAGETFTTPDFVAGLADDGLNGARHRLHRYVRSHVLPRPAVEEPRPVLYNSWEAMWFAVNEAGQLQLAERAAQLGIELFVVDDGWFLRRSLDNAGLGDWTPDPEKFPRGLGPLVERVNALGMRFGLWVEPEMVNPNSDLYRLHPDWVYAFPTRARSELRNQLVLNLGREDVRAYLFAALDALLMQQNIVYLKWDMNRAISEPGWMEYLAQGGEAREVWVRHTRAVYALMDALRARHPHLTIEACSSGGGRADLGILRRTDQVWTSDNTHPEARLFIQEGFSLALPARVMGAWVTDGGKDRFPLSFHFHVAMLGALGIGSNLLRWSASEMEEAARWIALYKQIRHLIQEGEQTWLLSPTATRGALTAVQYTAANQDEAVLFAFSQARALGEPLPSLRLRDLDRSALYRLEAVQADPPSPDAAHSQPLIFSGAALMARGLTLPLQEQFAYTDSFTSCALRLSRVMV